MTLYGSRRDAEQLEALRRGGGGAAAGAAVHAEYCTAYRPPGLPAGPEVTVPVWPLGLHREVREARRRGQRQQERQGGGGERERETERGSERGWAAIA
jgi:hypothetical protein